MLRKLLSAWAVLLVVTFSTDVLSMQLVHKVSTGKVRSLTYLRRNYGTPNWCQILRRDPRRQLQEAVRQEDLLKIEELGQFADCLSPRGSTPLLDAMCGHASRPVIDALIAKGANPVKRRLSGLQYPMMFAGPELRAAWRSSMNEAQFDFHCRWRLRPVHELSELLLTKDKEHLLGWCITKYSELEREFGGKPEVCYDGKNMAKSALARLIYNAVGTATGTLASLADPDFDEGTVLSHNADALASLGLLPLDEDVVDLHAARELARDLGRKLPIKVAELLSALMLHEDIALFADDLIQAYFHLMENFSDKPMPTLTSHYHHMIAKNIINQAILLLSQEAK
ncbi:MAG TPA: hypothetical protein VEL47_06720 [Myxococcota bacterium]|nr:hypothetical protein [Myxococcota bacterium]